jgi:DNA-binding XRE family transcriptional regulator
MRKPSEQVGLAVAAVSVTASTIAHYVPEPSWTLCYAISALGGLIVAMIFSDSP